MFDGKKLGFKHIAWGKFISTTRLEFAVLLPDTNLLDATNAMQRLVATIADRPLCFENRELPISVSVGVAEASDDDDDGALFIERADAALYATKNAGRNCGCVEKDGQ